MPPPSRTRRSAGELRSLIIQAGLNVLYRRGLRADASHVPMTEALDELEGTHGITVSMGSVFGTGRIWLSVKEFQLDLLEAALHDHDREGPNDQSFSLIDQLPDMCAEPFETRRDMLMEVCRIAGSVNGYVPEPGKGRTWTLWVAIWAMAMADNETGTRLLPDLRDATMTATDRFTAVYDVMLDRLGMRMRAPYTVEQMALLAAALTDGTTLRAGIIPEQLTATEGGTHPGEWSLLGIGYVAIVTEMIEDDPEI